eukprot:scaffold689_cov375-Prasinococcus_capsulatus_cf.AAC.22
MHEQESRVAAARAAEAAQRQRDMEARMAASDPSSASGRALRVALQVSQAAYVVSAASVRVAAGLARLLARSGASPAAASAWPSANDQAHRAGLESVAESPMHLAERIVSLVQKRGKLAVVAVLIVAVVVVSDIYDEYVQPADRPVDPSIVRAFHMQHLHAGSTTP